MSKYELTERLLSIIDQAKFIRNILINNNTAEYKHVITYIIELKEMVNTIKLIDKEDE